MKSNMNVKKRQGKLLAAVAVFAMVACALCIVAPAAELEGTTTTIDESFLGEVVNYEYDDGYEYKGTAVVSGTDVVYSYTHLNVPATGDEYPDLKNKVMNDLARFLGALYRMDSTTVTSITYDGVIYQWEPTAANNGIGNVGSNWYTGETTKISLVSAITADIATPENIVKLLNGEKMTLKVNDTDITYSIAPVVAKIESSGSTTYYNTVRNACLYADTGDVVILLDDVETEDFIQVYNQDITLDLNGKTITAADGYQQESIIIVFYSGKLTVVDSSFPSTGKIYSDNDKARIGILVLGNGQDLAELTVESGTIEARDFAITGNGTTHGTKITINGGEIKGYTAIYHPQDGSLEINGGHIVGSASGIEIRAGDLEITGGKIESTASEWANEPNGSGMTTIGASVAVSEHTTNVDITVNISQASGKVTQLISTQYALAVINPQDSTATPVVTIDGGTFTGTEGSVYQTYGTINYLGGTYDGKVANYNAENIDLGMSMQGPCDIVIKEGEIQKVASNGTFDGSITCDGNTIQGKFKAGDEGITITGGSLYIDGNLVDADGTYHGIDVTVNGDDIKISGTLGTGIVMEIDSGTKVTIPEGGSLELGDDSKIVIGSGSSLDDDGTGISMGTNTEIVIGEGSSMASSVPIMMEEGAKITTTPQSKVDATFKTATAEVYYPDYITGTKVVKSGTTYTIYDVETTNGLVQVGIAVGEIYYTGYDQAGKFPNVGVTSFDNNFPNTQGAKPTGYMYSSSEDEAAAGHYGTCLDVGEYMLHASFAVSNGPTTVGIEMDVPVEILPAKSIMTFDEYSGTTVYDVPVSQIGGFTVVQNGENVALTGNVFYYNGKGWAADTWPADEGVGYYALFEYDFGWNVIKDGYRDFDGSLVTMKVGDNVEKDWTYFSDGYLLVFLGDDSRIKDTLTVTIDNDGKTTGKDNFQATTYTIDFTGLSLESRIFLDDRVNPVYGQDPSKIVDFLIGETIADDNTVSFGIEGDVYYFNWTGVNGEAQWPDSMIKGYYLVFDVTSVLGDIDQWNGSEISMFAYSADGTTKIFDGYMVKFLGETLASNTGSTNIIVDLDGNGTEFFESTYALSYDVDAKLNIEFSVYDKTNETSTDNYYGKQDEFAEFIDGLLVSKEKEDTGENDYIVEFTGTLPWMYDYTEFNSSNQLETRGYYFPYAITLPTGMSWDNIVLEVLKDGDVTKTFATGNPTGAFDGFFIQRIMNNEPALALRITVDTAVYNFELDFSGVTLDYESGYFKKAPADDNMFGIIKEDDVSDRTVAIIYNTNGVTGDLEQNFYYNGDLVYSEPVTDSPNGTRIWYFSFDDQMSDDPFRAGEYTFEIKSGNNFVETGTVTVTGLSEIVSGYEDNKADAAEIMNAERPTATATDVIDQTMFLVYNQYTWDGFANPVGYVYAPGISPENGTPMYQESLNIDNGVRFWYFSFLDQLSSAEPVRGGTYTLVIKVGDVEELRTTVVIDTSSNIVIEEPTFDEGETVLGKDPESVQTDVSISSENKIDYTFKGNVYYQSAYPEFWGGDGKSGYYVIFDVFGLPIDAQNGSDLYDLSAEYPNGWIQLGSGEKKYFKDLGPEANPFVIYLGPTEMFSNKYTIIVDIDGDDGVMYRATSYYLNFSELTANEPVYQIIYYDDYYGNNDGVLDETEEFIMDTNVGNYYRINDGPNPMKEFIGWKDETGKVFRGLTGVDLSKLDENGDNVVELWAQYVDGGDVDDGPTHTLEYWIDSALEYPYEHDRYVGAFTFLNDSVFADYFVDENFDMTDVMNDFAMYMGALYRNSNGEVTSVTFNQVLYTWNIEGTLQGSNWIDEDGKTLVSAVVDYFNAQLDSGINSTGYAFEIANDFGDRAVFNYTLGFEFYLGESELKYGVTIEYAGIDKVAFQEDFVAGTILNLNNYIDSFEGYEFEGFLVNNNWFFGSQCTVTEPVVFTAVYKKTEQETVKTTITEYDIDVALIGKELYISTTPVEGDVNAQGSFYFVITYDGDKTYQVISPITGGQPGSEITKKYTLPDNVDLGMAAVIDLVCVNGSITANAGTYYYWNLFEYGFEEDAAVATEKINTILGGTATVDDVAPDTLYFETYTEADDMDCTFEFRSFGSGDVVYTETATFANAGTHIWYFCAGPNNPSGLAQIDAGLYIAVMLYDNGGTTMEMVLGSVLIETILS